MKIRSLIIATGLALSPLPTTHETGELIAREAKPLTRHHVVKDAPQINQAEFVVSAYTPYDDVSGINADNNPHTTATGTTPRPGTIAIDPDVMPYGSEIKIIYPDGSVEYGIAEDTGGAIRGSKGEKRYRLDVFRHKYSDAMKFGMRDAVVMWRERGNE